MIHFIKKTYFSFSKVTQVPGLCVWNQERRRGRVRGVNGWSCGTRSWNRLAFLTKGWHWPGRMGVEETGGRGWAHSGGMRGGVRGSLALNLFHMTHSHGLCLDSLFLSVSPPLSPSGMAMRGRRWGRGRDRGVFFSDTTGALWWQGPGHVTHQELWWLSLSHREGFIKYPSSLPPVSLLLGSWAKTTHHYWRKIHSLRV